MGKMSKFWKCGKIPGGGIPGGVKIPGCKFRESRGRNRLGNVEIFVPTGRIIKYSFFFAWKFVPDSPENRPRGKMSKFGVFGVFGLVRVRRVSRVVRAIRVTGFFRVIQYFG